MLRTAARPAGAAAALVAAAVLVLAGMPDPARAHTPATAGTPTCLGADVDPGAAGATVTRQALLCLLNWERAGAGQRPVVLDDRLSAAAQAHSDDMVARNYFAHDAPPPTPSHFDERITAAGYAWATAGENIAVGLATPRTVITAWLGSQSHCQSVLSPSFTAVGFGFNSGDVGRFSGPAWTQTLGRSQAEPGPGGTPSACPTTPAQPAPYDPMRWYNRFFGPNHDQDGKSSGQGGLGDPTTVVALPPPPVVPPPVVTPPEPVLTIAKLRRAKRTLRLELTLPASSAKSKKPKKKSSSKKKSSRSSKKKSAKQRSRALPAVAQLRATSKTPKKATKKSTKKKSRSPKMTVALRVVQKGQKARNFRFRRTAGRTYRLRIQLRQPKHGTLRVQVAGHKARARFK